MIEKLGSIGQSVECTTLKGEHTEAKNPKKSGQKNRIRAKARDLVLPKGRKTKQPLNRFPKNNIFC